MNFTGVKTPEPPKTVNQYRPVTDYMTKDVITFHKDQSIAEAMDTFLELRISGAPVVDDSGRIAGILSEVDCLKIMVDEAYHNLPHGRISVENYMSDKVATVSMDADVLDIASKFLRTHFRRFPVVDHNDKLIGQVSRRDILKATRDLKTSTW
ncbi:CBS domain-containing protein [Roseivirga sp. E12]|uniref:CBS domain-containing protein n=1 Tax=Roseivirga sp. E12 TaxID=2819237 RepID=UPI001ABBF2C4|nr:CBS domain-containing protein [Roseivirga sp. E12]MBO3696995.1 CBS domain-containing protein [Roseivirga sp. E12]